MNYGFVIDNRLCIGCHACSTACKAENEVPLGVNRTWVKYVETGAVCDSFEKLQECQAQRALDRANVEWGYFTETAPHMVSSLYSESQNHTENRK